MADISRLSRLLNGIQRQVDLSSNALVVGSIKIGASNLEITADADGFLFGDKNISNVKDLTLKGQLAQDAIYANGDSGAAATIDWDNGNIQEIEITANTVLTFANGKDSGEYLLVINQDATGGFSVDFPSDVQFENADVSVNTGADSKTYVSFLYDSGETGKEYRGFSNNGFLGLGEGGTGASLAASAGSIVYSDSDSMEMGPVGNAGEILLSGGTAAPSWGALDDSSIELSGSTIQVKAGGIGENELNNVDGGVDAESFVLTSGYAASAGTVANGDTIEAAIAKLDGNGAAAQSEIDAIEAAMGGVIDANGDYVAHSGSNYIDGNASVTEDLLDLDAQAKTNADDISTNAGNISTNAGNISTNAGNISANADDIGNLVTLSGVAVDSTDLGTFTGSTIVDNRTVKEALQDLETAHEEVDTNVNDLVTLSGVAENATDLGSFAGSVIADNETVKGALQDLEDAIGTVSSGLDWKTHAKAITADADLNTASNGDTLSSLLPFSDDESPQLAVGDFAAGDFILSVNTSGADKLFYVYDDGGTLKVEDDTGSNHAGVAMEALAAGHTFYVRYDLPDSPAGQENSASYAFNGTDLIKIGDVDWNFADGIDLTTSYSAAAGVVAGGDSIEAAIEKLDGNISVNTGNISTNAGNISTNAGNISTNAGNISSAQSEIDAIEAAMGAVIDTNGDYVAHSGTNYIDGNADVTEDLLDLDTQVKANADTGSTNAGNISSAQSEIDAIEAAMGAAVDANGDYVAHSGSNYIDGNADITEDLLDLDTQMKTNADDISTNAGNISTNAGNISTNAGNISANTDDIGNLVSLSGVAVDSTDLGAFTGSTIVDNRTVKEALQDLETAYEETDSNVDDLVSLSGVAENATDLGAFTGTIITDNSSIKGALQELETQLEAAGDASLVVKTMVAGEAYAANTVFAVRMSMNGETDTRVYKADEDAATTDTFHVIGLVYPTVAISAGDDIDVVLTGEILSSVAFTASQDEGKPVFLSTSGAITLTPPSANDKAVVKVGVVAKVGAAGTAKILVSGIQVMGVN